MHFFLARGLEESGFLKRMSASRGFYSPSVNPISRYFGRVSLNCPKHSKQEPFTLYFKHKVVAGFLALVLLRTVELTLGKRLHTTTSFSLVS